MTGCNPFTENNIEVRDYLVPSSVVDETDTSLVPIYVFIRSDETDTYNIMYDAILLQYNILLPTTPVSRSFAVSWSGKDRAVDVFFS